MQQSEKAQMPKILYVDMDNVLVDSPSAIARIPEQLLNDYEGRLGELPSIISCLPRQGH